LAGLAAIAIVAVAALLIGATAKMMSNTVDWIETASYVLIIVIGARLVWVKGKSFRATLRNARAGGTPERAGADRDHGHADADGHRHCQHSGHAHNGHQHDDEEEGLLPWGHAHGPEPGQLAGPEGWRRGLWTIVAVGLRPCSGAIIVLVFALAQGLFWAGVASTFVMGLGTAVTVGTIASLAVGAKSLARRLSARPTGYGVLVLRGLEVCAACLVILVGVALLTGYMASERMGFF
jgi:nickel/cobalt transporter (NicO) family protein